MRRALLRSRRGLTMTEVMIVVVVLLTMSLMVWEALRNSMEFNEVLGSRDQTTRSARAAMSKIRRELQVAYLTPARTAVETVQTVFVGLDEDPDTLYFTTLAHQRLYMNSRESDQAEVTLFAESAPRDVSRGHVLYHRESPRVPAQIAHIELAHHQARQFQLRTQTGLIAVVTPVDARIYVYDVSITCVN